MIARLRGEVIEVSGDALVIDCHGVGYEVHAPENVLLSLSEIGSHVDVYVRQVFREDGVTLYGFLDGLERRLFDLLMDVKGCGPRTALAILGTLGVDPTISAIQVQDVKVLTRANGVGPRLAERILLELREKIQQVALERKISAPVGLAVTQHSTRSDELVDALMALGLRRNEAEAAASEARTQSDVLEEQIRIALRSK